MHEKDYLSPIMEVIEPDAKVLADAISGSGNFKPAGDYDPKGVN